ncbi:MAG TPA: SWIM zinc finger family protein [Yinghuangia sp.]|uniref:SWIM zinc finger family protein n=1 Tax=Yinghuangia sp. YIM S10712 TaxID=3436930 RepID=UPI002B81133A|nr:SWIM zinc finger family protein [Yinghuangia sp.]
MTHEAASQALTQGATREATRHAAAHAAPEARGFTAFPAGRRGGRAFARSWWGRAWLQAVEDSALDLEALRVGRKYAYTGRVGSITVAPGRLTAPVYAESGDVHRTTQLLQPLTARQWDRFLDQVAARAGHIAALLDRDMPHDLVAAAEDVGVPLLPGIGDLDPSCDCEDWGHPCRHAAALAYQAAWLLDADPFVLLLMRGMSEERFLDALQKRGASAPEPGMEPQLTSSDGKLVPAVDAYATTPGTLPEPPPLPDAPGDMPDLPAGPGVDPEALRLLAREAAARALNLLADASAAASAREGSESAVADPAESRTPAEPAPPSSGEAPGRQIPA